MPSESNSLDPDQDQQNVGPDLGSHCLQRLSADDTIATRQRVNFGSMYRNLAFGLAV